MMETAGVDSLRKSAVKFVLSAEQLLKSMLKSFARCTEAETEYLRLRSAVVVAARASGQADLVPDIMGVDAVIEHALTSHGSMWEGIRGDVAEIAVDRQAAFLESLADCIVRLRRATDRLDAVAGLHTPIETRVFSNWHLTKQLLAKADISRSKWQRTRRDADVSGEIQSHPKSGTKMVRLTQKAADRLGIQLPEFQ